MAVRKAMVSAQRFGKLRLVVGILKAESVVAAADTKTHAGLTAEEGSPVAEEEVMVVRSSTLLEAVVVRID